MELSACRRLTRITGARPAMAQSFQLSRERSAMTSSWLTRWRWYAEFASFCSRSFLHESHYPLFKPWRRCGAADIIWQPSGLPCLGMTSTTRYLLVMHASKIAVGDVRIAGSLHILLRCDVQFCIANLKS